MDRCRRAVSSLWVRLPDADAVAVQPPRCASTASSSARPAGLARRRLPRPHPDRLRRRARAAGRGGRAAGRRLGGLRAGRPALHQVILARQRLARRRWTAPAGSAPVGLDWGPPMAELPDDTPPARRRTPRGDAGPASSSRRTTTTSASARCIEAFLDGPPTTSRRTRRRPPRPMRRSADVRRPVPLDTRPDWDIALRHEDARVARYGRPASVIVIRLRLSPPGSEDRLASRVGEIVREHARETDRVTRCRRPLPCPLARDGARPRRESLARARARRPVPSRSLGRLGAELRRGRRGRESAATARHCTTRSLGADGRRGPPEARRRSADERVEEPLQLGGRIVGQPGMDRRRLDDRARRRHQPVEPLRDRQAGDRPARRARRGRSRSMASRWRLGSIGDVGVGRERREARLVELRSARR